MTVQRFVGTAGWSIPSQYRAAFSEDGSHLERYARRFNAVEINSSFYRPHRIETYRRWAASVPPAFRFSVKLPRQISHDARLIDCAAPLQSFADQVGGLEERLGVVLIQLPPSLVFDRAVADAFFADIRSALAAPLALEPRHPSWFSDQAEALLVDRCIARVAADPAPTPGASEPGGWPGLRYFRLHGSPVIYRSAYGDARLRDFAERLADSAGDAVAWCIFDNTAGMAATGDALAFDDMLRPSA